MTVFSLLGAGFSSSGRRQGAHSQHYSVISLTLPLSLPLADSPFQHVLRAYSIEVSASSPEDLKEVSPLLNTDLARTNGDW